MMRSALAVTAAASPPCTHEQPSRMSAISRCRPRDTRRCRRRSEKSREQPAKTGRRGSVSMSSSRRAWPWREHQCVPRSVSACGARRSSSASKSMLAMVPAHSHSSTSGRSALTTTPRPDRRSRRLRLGASGASGARASIASAGQARTQAPQPRQTVGVVVDRAIGRHPGRDRDRPVGGVALQAPQGGAQGAPPAVGRRVQKLVHIEALAAPAGRRSGRPRRTCRSPRRARRGARSRNPGRCRRRSSPGAGARGPRGRGGSAARQDLASGGRAPIARSISRTAATNFGGSPALIVNMRTRSGSTPTRVEQALREQHAVDGVEVALAVVALALEAAGHHGAVGIAGQGFEQVQRRDAAGAGHEHEAHRRRQRRARVGAGVGRRVGALATAEGHDGAAGRGRARGRCRRVRRRTSGRGARLSWRAPA